MSPLRRISQSWITRTLAVGAVSVSIDVSLGLLVLWLGGPTRAAAMVGSTTGSIFTYFANRHFAFRDSKVPLARSGIKFAVMTLITNTLHGQVVVWYRELWGMPYVVAKLAADLTVVTIPQLLLLRHVVFPKAPNDTP